MSVRAYRLGLLLLSLLPPRKAGAARTVTIQTDAARRDVDGNYIDAHDGKIVEHGGTYFLYGESYGNQTLVRPTVGPLPASPAPKPAPLLHW